MKIISVHSFRGGTGKSNLSANLAVCLAMEGNKVAIFDTDLASPGVHVLFDFAASHDDLLLNDFLQSDAPIKKCVHEVTPKAVRAVKGHIWLAPASMESDKIAKILREGYVVEKLNDAIFGLVDDLDLDYVIIDTHPGINEETLLSVAISDALIVVMRPDAQDYLGTAVAIEVAERLDVPQINLVVNKLPEYFEPESVKERVKSSFDYVPSVILPLSSDLLNLASSGLAVLEYSDHEWSVQVKQLALTIHETLHRNED